MNELASKLFKTFFQSKKYFLSSENELVEVTSKTHIFEILMRQNPQIQDFVWKPMPGYGHRDDSEPILKNVLSFFLIN